MQTTLTTTQHQQQQQQHQQQQRQQQQKPQIQTAVAAADLLKTMQQQSAQNMLMTTVNKKKKYAQQQQSQHYQQMPHKTFNMVSILKTAASTPNGQATNVVAATTQQQQPHNHHHNQQQQLITQSYANVVNRSIPTPTTTPIASAVTLASMATTSPTTAPCVGIVAGSGISTNNWHQHHVRIVSNHNNNSGSNGNNNSTSNIDNHPQHQQQQQQQQHIHHHSQQQLLLTTADAYIGGTADTCLGGMSSDLALSMAGVGGCSSNNCGNSLLATATTGASGCATGAIAGISNNILTATTTLGVCGVGSIALGRIAACCIDSSPPAPTAPAVTMNKKYDYSKSNKLLLSTHNNNNNISFPNTLTTAIMPSQSQEYVPTASTAPSNNVTNSGRGSHQQQQMAGAGGGGGGGGMYRGPPPTVQSSQVAAAAAAVAAQQQPQPVHQGGRSGGVGAARHIPMSAMYPQAMHQSVVVPYSPYTQRQPQFQTQQYSYTQHIPAANYFPYQNFYTIQQPPPQAPPHQRGVGGLSMGVGGAMSGPGGPNGPMTGPPGAPGTAQVQNTLSQGAVLTTTGGVASGGTGAPSVLSVATNPATGAQVGVSVPQSLVGVVPPQQTVPQPQQQQMSTTKRLRPHALEIIHPDTKKNILEDLDFDLAKNTSATTQPIELDYQDQHNITLATTMQPQSDIVGQQAATQQTQQEHLAGIQPYNFDMHQIHPTQSDLIVVGQTPIVSAMSDAPSVEILPMPQKSRSKKIPIVPPKEDQSFTQNAQTIKDTKKQQPATATIAAAETPATLSNSSKDATNVVIKSESVQQQQHQQQTAIQVQEQQTTVIEAALTAAVADISSRNSNTSIETGNPKATKTAKPSTGSKINEQQQKTATVPPQQQQSSTTASSLPSSVVSLSSEDMQLNENKTDTSSMTKTLVATATTAASEQSQMVSSDTTTAAANLNNRENKVAENKLDASNDINNQQANNENVNAKHDAATEICDETDRATIPIDEPLAAAATTLQHQVDASNNGNSIARKVAEAQQESVTTPTKLANMSTDTLATSVEASTAAAAKIAEDEIKQTTASERKTTKTTTPIDNEQEKQSAAPTETIEATPMAAASSKSGPSQQATSLLLNYNEGQWSPQNPTGKKQYDRNQLMQLREAIASRVQPEVNNASILPQPNLMPSFVRNNTNKRVQSMMGSISGGGGRGSIGPVGEGGERANAGVGATGNYGKQASMSGSHGRGMIHVTLSLNQDVKLSETDNAWRPRALVKGNSNSSATTNDGDGTDANIRTSREKEDLIRRIRGILNKLTPEKFDTLVEEIIKLKIDTPDKMEDVMVLVFEKAIDEPNFSVSYARLCHRLITEVKARDERMESGTKTNLAHFRNALLDKTEREFTQNVTQSTAKQSKLQPIIDKIKECENPVERAELEAQLEEEERKIRRRSGGTVRFIGELFKISMLTGKIIRSCIDTLLNPNSEDMLECLCKLLTTVGAKFEQTPVNAKDPKRCYSLETIMQRMQAVALKTDKEGAKVSSRVRFMLQDVIDLRKDKWQSKRVEAPQTMGQIQKEAQKEQYLSYAGAGSLGGNGPISAGGSISGSSANGPASMSTSGGGKRGGDDRGSSGRYNNSSGSYGGSHGSQRGDTGSLRRRNDQQSGNSGGGSSHSNGQNDDSTWHVQTGKGARSLDTSKLEGLNKNLDISNKKMGGMQQFLWTNKPAPPPTTTPNSFAPLSSMVDSHKSNDRDRDRDRDHRGGPRNKGSYSKGSMERDRYGDRGLHTRSGSSQASRENSSSRIGGGSQIGRGGGGPGMMNAGASSMQKSASHSKYTMPTEMPTRASGKSSDMSSAATTGSALYGRGGSGVSANDQQISFPAAGRQSQPAAAKVVKTHIPPIPVFEEPNNSDTKLIKSVVSEMLENVTNTKIINASTIASINHIKETQRCGFLWHILTNYLHLGHVGQVQRRYLGSIVAYLIKQNFLSVEHFRLSYEQFCNVASDLIFDIPALWLYIFEFSGPLIVNKVITINDLWNKDLREDCDSPDLGRKFLKTFLLYCTREIGPSYTRGMWKNLKMKWSDFMPEDKVREFIEANKFAYIENESIQPEIVIKEPKEEHINRIVEHIDQLLRENSTADYIIDYVNGNLIDIDKHFIRSLTTTLCNFGINYKDDSYKLDSECFRKICIPVLIRYIDSKEERELECLYAMQLLVHDLEHPRALLSEIFAELYDADVIPQDSFIKWRDSKDQSAGKGVAVKGLNPFFNHLLSPDTSDENN